MAAKKKTAKKATTKKKTAKKASTSESTSSPPTAAFALASLKAELEAKSVRAILGKDGKPTKKKEQTLEILTFDNDDVVGHVVGVISSQSVAIDEGIGIGGYPRGRIIEVSGENSTGKTTLAAHAIAEVQKIGGVAMVVDTEEKMDAVYSAHIGVKADQLIVVQPKRKTFESVLNALRDALDHWIAQGLQNVPLLIVWDSVGATPTESEYGKDFDDNALVGGASKQLSGAMRVLTGRLAAANATLFAINHIYTDIKTGFAARFGSKKVTYGGKAIRFHASVRIELVRTGAVKVRRDSEEVMVGSEILVKFIKNNVGVPMRNRTVAILWGIGLDNVVPIFWKLQQHKYITGSGGWYRFATSDGDEVKFQKGFVGFGEKVCSDPELFKKCVTIYNALVANE